MAGTQFAVDLVFKTQGGSQIKAASQSIDKVSDAAKKAQGSVDKASNNIRKFGQSSATASGGIKTLGTALKSALGPLVALTSGAAALTAAFKTISGQDFAVAKLKTLGVASDVLVANLKDVSRELNGSASVAELTAAAYDVASAGFSDAADNAKVLKASALGAAGGFTDLNTAGNALTSVLNAYGLSAAEAEKVMDQFVQTQNDGKIVVAEYAQNIGKVASAAAALGVPLAEVNTAIAQSTASGVQAEQAFTGVAASLARLASGEAAKALEGTGVSISAATLKADGLIGTLKKIDAAGLSTGQVIKAFGIEGARAMLPLLNNLDKAEQLLKNQENAVGTAVDAQKIAAATIEGAWKRVTTAFSNFTLEVGGSAKPLITVLNGIADAVNLITSNFAELVKITASIGSAVLVFKAYAIAVKGIAAATSLWAAATKAAAAAKATLMAILNPATIATTIAAVGVGVGVYYGLGAAIDGATKEAEKNTEEIEKNAGATDEVTTAMEQLKAATDGTADAAKDYGNVIQQVSAELDAQAKKQESIASMTFEIAQQRNKVEQAITGTLLDQAQAQLDGAKTQKERIKAAEAIYELTVRQAELEAEAAKAAVAESVRKVESQLKFLQLKEREIAAAVALAEADGVANQQHQKALELAGAAVEEAATQLKLKQELAKLQNKEIDALLQGKINTAEMAYQQNIVANETERAANSAGSFASNMGQAATQAERAAAAVQRAASSGGGYRVNHGQKVTQTSSWGADVSQETVNAVLSKHSANSGVVQGNNGDWHINWDSSGVGRGEMTYNKLLNQMRDHQLGQIQAQAYNERNAQLMAAHREWVAQGSGGQGGNVSVNYSGSTMNFDGNQYVNQKDVNGIVQQAVTAVNNNLRRSSSTRLSLGLT
ncbi:MAG: phage tail tape measure protein [Cyanobium sp. ARS6]|nr:phage tail tape measure protein [Cyanobium sp. ARS6]